MANKTFTALTEAQKNGLYSDEYWQKRLLKMIALEQSEMVFTNLGVEKSVPKNQGTKNFTMRRYNRLPVDLEKQLLQEGIAPDAMKIEGNKVTGTVNQYGARIAVSDVTEDIHFDNIREVYQPELARHASETIERNILASFSEASEWFVGNGTDVEDLVETDVLTLKDLRRVALSMRVNLRKGHTRGGGKPIVVVSPQVMNDLLDDEDLEKKALATGMENTPIKNGSLKSYKIYDMWIQESLISETQEVTVDEGGEDEETFTVYTSYVLGFEPYAVLKLGNLSWHNVPFSAAPGNELAQLASVGYKLWTGAKVIDPLAIHKVYSRSGYDVIDYTDTDKWAKPADQTEPEAGEGE